MFLPHRQSWKLTSVCVRAELAAKGTAHWFHLREAVVWVQVMRLRAGRRTLGMAYNCIVTLCNESLIFSAPGWRLTSSITRSPSQCDVLGKVRSPRDSLSPPRLKMRKLIIGHGWALSQMASWCSLIPSCWSEILCVWEMRCVLQAGVRTQQCGCHDTPQSLLYPTRDFSSMCSPLFVFWHIFLSDFMSSKWLPQYRDWVK